MKRRCNVLLSHRLRKIRRAKDLTQQELGALAGVNYVTISRIEGGDEEKAHARTVMRLAKALEVTTDELLGMDTFTLAPAHEKEPAPLPAKRKSRRSGVSS
jgi:transcriptional regulator with XRE-family HTH domain